MRQRERRRLSDARHRDAREAASGDVQSASKRSENQPAEALRLLVAREGKSLLRRRFSTRRHGAPHRLTTPWRFKSSHPHSPVFRFEACPEGETKGVDTWVWIALAVAAVVIIALVLLGQRRARERRVEKQREEAGQLREEAQERLGTAGQREAVAQQEAERARREREAAEQAIRRADDVDPDVP